MKSLRELAKAQPCMLRIPTVCNYDTETTVLCHLSSGYGGTGLKSPDWWAVLGCSDCHDWLDKRTPDPDWMESTDRLECEKRALYRTLEFWKMSGVLDLP